MIITAVTSTPEIDDLIRDWEEASSPLEFSARVMECLWALPAAKRDAALEHLSAHADETVRQVASEWQAFARQRALSTDLDHVRRNSPLRPGVRLALFGGYDYYATEGKPAWLNGRECYRATFLRFATRGDDTIPAGLVEFDEVIEIPGHNGRFGILLAGYGQDFFAWEQPEEDVVVYVTQVLPGDVSSFRFDGRASPDPIETHATYRVEASA